MNGNRITLDESQVNRHLLEIRKNLVKGRPPVESRPPVDDNIPAQASLFDFASTFGSIPDNPKLQEEARRHSENLLREGRFRLSPNQRQVYYTVRMEDGSDQVLLKNPQEILFFPLIPDKGDPVP
jgi:hypothetical protein